MQFPGFWIYSLLFFLGFTLNVKGQSPIFLKRFDSNPIIKPSMLEGKEGANISFPSLIKVPDWIHKKLGKYYLYFSNENGTYIRMAYANDLKGPWKIHEGGALRIEECICRDPKITNPGTPENHIASPDVHVNLATKEIVLYYHCPLANKGTRYEKDFTEFTLRAVSKDGIVFKSDTVRIADAYMRMFTWRGRYYGIAQKGNLFRSADAKGPFEPGPNPFDKPNLPSTLRHPSVKIVGDNLYVFFSRVGEKPERIYVSQIPLNADWNTWKPSAPLLVIEPEQEFEGAKLPYTSSKPGPAAGKVRELRDPFIFEENLTWYLLYTVEGESGIAIAEFHLIGKKPFPGKY